MKTQKILWLLLFLCFIPVCFADDTLIGDDVIDYKVNTLLSSRTNKISMLIPALMLTICIISFATDYGTVGVTAASMGSLVIISLLGFIYINPVSLISFVIMIGIIIFKLTK